MLLVGFAGVTWFAGTRTDGEGISVGIVPSEDQSPIIEAGEAKLERISSTAVELSAMSEEPKEIKPIEEFGSGERKQRELTITLDVGGWFYSGGW